MSFPYSHQVVCAMLLRLPRYLMMKKGKHQTTLKESKLIVQNAKTLIA